MENAFEKIKKVSPSGKEFWSARELYPLFGYLRWENFEVAIGRAKESCKNSGQKVSDHLREVTKSIESGKGAKRDYKDFNLTRYACYLIAQNGDPRKEEIALAQTYFAIKTRQQEMQDDLIEDYKRVNLREVLKDKNIDLVKSAKSVGVRNFANFQDSGYMGLYGGLRQKQIKNKKGLQEKDQLLDNIGSEELSANWFRATQAEAKIRRENAIGEGDANMIHRKAGETVRKAIKDLGGTMPENLPKKDNIKNAKKRLGSEHKRLGKNSGILLNKKYL